MSLLYTFLLEPEPARTAPTAPVGERETVRTRAAPRTPAFPLLSMTDQWRAEGLRGANYGTLSPFEICAALFEAGLVCPIWR